MCSRCASLSSPVNTTPWVLLVSTVVLGAGLGFRLTWNFARWLWIRRVAALLRDAASWLAEAPEEHWLFAIKDVAEGCADQKQLISLERTSRRDRVPVPGVAWPPQSALTMDGSRP